MTGLIDVGGGMKCAYSAGLYDYFMDNSIKFDYCLGVSAGSLNLLSYIAGERGRMIDMYRESAVGDEYLSLSNLIHNGTYMNYDKVRRDYFNPIGANAFNFERFYSENTKFVVAATEGKSTDTVFFEKEQMNDTDRLLDIISASCCIPVVSHPIIIDNKEYFDGGIAEPIPMRRAFEDGCDKIVVVLSAPFNEKREKLPGIKPISNVFLRDYPLIDDVMEERHAVYNYLLRVLREYEKRGKALVFSPDNIEGAFSLVKNDVIVNKLYENGYRDGLNRKTELLKLMEE